jgi:ammonium transporter, Amt family
MYRLIRILTQKTVSHHNFVNGSGKGGSSSFNVERLGEDILCVLRIEEKNDLWSMNGTYLAIAVLIIFIFATAATAAQAISPTPEWKVGLNTAWVLLSAFLVFFMNAGFGFLEAGFCRQKNAVNALAKSLIVFALASIAYWAIGFGLMFANGTPLFGLNGWFLSGLDNSPISGNFYNGTFSALKWVAVPLQGKFLFQLTLAGVAAAIVSGAMAERIKFKAFLAFSLIFIGILYPITGHWVWGGGWLAHFPNAVFWDFAGSTTVHSVAGWAALMGAMLLGPRFGRFAINGVNAIPGHNLNMATLGCFILWFGWFGLNVVARMTFEPMSIAHIAVTTNTAAVFGAVAALIVSWKSLGKPKLPMMIHGVLAGLVAISASCAWVTIPSAAVIGAIAGILVVFSISFADRLKIDDPTGSISVHLVCGIWGTLAVGLFAVGASSAEGSLYRIGPSAGLILGGGLTQLLTQIVGVVSVGIFMAIASTFAWLIIKAIFGLRVTAEDELRGLDISEHEMEAYIGFVKEDT